MYRFKLAKDVDLLNLANLCPKNLTGADLYAFCSDAMLASIRKKIIELENKGICGDQVMSGDIISLWCNVISIFCDISLSLCMSADYV